MSTRRGSGRFGIDRKLCQRLLVEVDGGRGRRDEGIGIVGNAAEDDLVLARRRTDMGNVRQEAHEILEVLQAFALQFITCQRLDAARDVLQALLALARGDDDLFECRAGALLLCGGVRCVTRQCRGDGNG
jgi:hypothetical protein